MKNPDNIIKYIKKNGKKFPFFYRYVELLDGKSNPNVRKIVESSYYDTKEYSVIHYYKPIIIY